MLRSAVFSSSPQPDNDCPTWKKEYLATIERRVSSWIDLYREKVGAGVFDECYEYGFQKMFDNMQSELRPYRSLLENYPLCQRVYFGHAIFTFQTNEAKYQYLYGALIKFFEILKSCGKGFPEGGRIDFAMEAEKIANEALQSGLLAKLFLTKDIGKVAENLVETYIKGVLEKREIQVSSAVSSPRFSTSAQLVTYGTFETDSKDPTSDKELFVGDGGKKSRCPIL